MLTLEHLLEQVTPDTLHDEVDMGDDMGEEAWGRIDLSRTALADAWEGPEEDEAWKNL